MRTLIFILIFVFFSKLHATNYYIASSGNDGSSGTSSTSPWKTISKLNTFFKSIKSGDTIFFKRGDIFYGKIIVNSSGLINSPIVISSYGNGEKPIISGQTIATGWINIGSNLWKSSAITNVSNSLNMVTINDQATPMGRFPDLKAQSSGYLYFESTNGTNSITDTQLSGTPNWSGASIVIRSNLWTLLPYTITNHNGNTITFAGNSSYIENNYGYFIQNNVLTLNQQNEWYFDKVSKQVIIYSDKEPTGIKISTIDTLCTIINKNYIVIDGLEFQGANRDAISLNITKGISILNCTIKNSGNNAVRAKSSIAYTIQNCIIRESYNMGLNLDEFGNSLAIIKFNNISKSGTIPGMGESLTGIGIEGSGNLIEGNTIDSCGYNGIEFFKGNNNVIKNNLVRNFCFVKSDGGGVYSWNNDYTPVIYTNNKIVGNIILNGIGIFDGTNSKTTYVHGIYMDDNSGNVEISDNTVSNVNGSGLFIHNNFNMNIQRNTFYNNGITQTQFTHDLAYIDGDLAPYNTPIRNIKMKNNIFFAKTYLQSVFDISSIKNDIESVGVIDSNYYVRPQNQDDIINITRKVGSKDVNNTYSLNRWRKIYPVYDKQTKETPKVLSICNSKGANLVSNGKFTSNISGWIVWSSNGNQSISFDNSGKITEAGSCKIQFPSSVPGEYSFLSTAVGAVSSNKNYSLKFNSIGTVENAAMLAFVRQTNGSQLILSTEQNRNISTSVGNHELIFKSPITDQNASIFIAIEQNSGTVYIDNVEFNEVNSFVNVNDSIRFEYNTNKTPLIISLNGVYTDVRKNIYNGTITLQPYSSAVLIRTDSVKVDTLNTSVINIRDYSSDILVYPNPTNDKLVIELNSEFSNNVRIDLYNVEGKLIYSEIANNLIIPINVHSLSKGIYILKLTSDRKYAIKKFLKE